MTSNISRSQFLSGDFSGNNLPIRPPWALSEELFIERCTRCSECVKACPYHLIKEGRGKFPIVDFSIAGCDFCRDCVNACEPGALNSDPDLESTPWTLKAEILSNCLSLNSIVCRACGDTCEERAITFKLELGGVARPNLDRQACTGCGECYAVCPIKSVTIKPEAPQEQAA
ncbi:MAG: ferredoxin-type protein NapF [Gammaproteobacteria bacterium]|nr:ferredoxin-type protein NapF [Gammaproteobacteria bacterium]